MYGWALYTRRLTATLERGNGLSSQAMPNSVGVCILGVRYPVVHMAASAASFLGKTNIRN